MNWNLFFNGLNKFTSLRYLQVILILLIDAIEQSGLFTLKKEMLYNTTFLSLSNFQIISYKNDFKFNFFFSHFR